MDKILEMYCDQLLSITQISKLTGVPLSTIRFRLLKNGVLRSRSEAIKIAAKDNRLGSGMRGKSYVMSKQHRDNLSKAKIAIADKKAKGVSLKPSGYFEFTRGEHKSRLVHVVLMEQKIGRRLYSYECVHHIDHDKTNNDLSNLQLMTRSEHSLYHINNRIKKD